MRHEKGHVMKIINRALGGLALAALTASCWAAPPSEQSILTLLDLTQAQSMLESSMGNMEKMVRQGMVQASAGKELTDEQKRVLEVAPGKIVAAMREQLNWDTLKPMYLTIYKESFDQTEIDGLIAFYRSPIGQSFIAKMPVVMQKTVGLMQQQMQQFLPRLQESMKQALEDAKVTR